MHDQPLRILYLAAEVEPFARTGGLAEVAGALPKALHERGHDVRVAMPRYGHITPDRWDIAYGDQFAVPFDRHEEQAALAVTMLPATTIPVWLIDNQRFFGSPEVYLGEQDAERFIFWCRATLEAARHQDWRPDVIHANDWHAAIVPNWLRTTLRRDPFFKETASLYTIHTLAYRGVFGRRVLEIAGVDAFGFITHPDLPNLSRLVDLMSRGIYYADIINTVSPTYAQEILSSEFGEGLDPLLRDRRDRLFGVLNGIDTQRFDPASDAALPQTYDGADLAGKLACKTALQRAAGFEEDPEVPLFLFIGRLNDQKGFGLLSQTLELLLPHHRFQSIIVGTGEDRYHTWVQNACERFPNQIRAFFTFNDALTRLCYAGADVLVMPSLIEPGGTNQLIALRYGTLPLVRATGGLADTVEDIDALADHGVGFVFRHPEVQALYGTFLRALELYRHPTRWTAAVHRALKMDWSWQRAAARYEELYRRAVASRLARRPRSSYARPNSNA